MKIRVLHLTTDSKIAGAEKLLIGIAQHYNKEKFQMFFATLKPEGDLHKYLRATGGMSFSLGYRNFFILPSVIHRFIKAIRQNKIDIIHIHLCHAGVFGWLVSRFFQIPKVVMTRHYSNAMYLYGNFFEQYLDKLVAQWVNHIIAISEGVKKTLVDLDKVEPSKITVIYNGIKLAGWQSSDDTKQTCLKDKLHLKGYRIVGSIGILHPRKGHRYLLEAIKEIDMAKNKIKVLIVGDGHLMRELTNLARELDIAENVIFSGYQSDIADYISVMDILVQPSLEEGFGITILEAMAMGRPVIATNVGGIPEIVNDGVNGILVPPGNPLLLAKEIVRLLEDSDYGMCLGKRARKTVEEKFTIGPIVKKYEQLYERLQIDGGSR